PIAPAPETGSLPTVERAMVRGLLEAERGVAGDVLPLAAPGALVEVMPPSTPAPGEPVIGTEPPSSAGAAGSREALAVEPVAAADTPRAASPTAAPEPRRTERATSRAPRAVAPTVEVSGR